MAFALYGGDYLVMVVGEVGRFVNVGTWICEVIPRYVFAKKATTLMKEKL